MDWFKNKHNFILKNPVYLEINCNIKTIIILKNPQYNNIPYPKNLERNLRIGWPLNFKVQGGINAPRSVRSI